MANAEMKENVCHSDNSAYFWSALSKCVQNDQSMHHISAKIQSNPVSRSNLHTHKEQIF